MTRYRIRCTSGRPVEGAEAVPVHTWHEYFVDAPSIEEIAQKYGDLIVHPEKDGIELEIYDDYRE